MTKEIITLTIDRLAGLGDGNGTCGERKVFVPLTLDGEVVEAEIVKEIAGVTYCKLVKIITPSNDRKEPICKHFGECGGCTLQHLNDNLYPQFKRKIAAEALRKA
ncbi:MAG: RNA methyltransferase, partial [Pseudomonadota bacterium]